MPVTPELLERLRRIVGTRGCVDGADIGDGQLVDWRGAVRGRSPLLLRPDSVAQVAAILAACNETGVGVVPQGGNTGMCAAAVPDAGGEQVILSLSRLNRVRELDIDGATLVAEAGCVLAELQALAADAGLLLPLSLGAEGSCQIGGNLSTNAGGVNVLRYGTARRLALGLEVVLADGSVLDGLRRLPKDTAGYDLKQLFIGSEGTLGVITAAALQLVPAARARCAAFIALDAPARAPVLLRRCQTAMPDRVQAFELLPAIALDAVAKHVPALRQPFATPPPWSVLAEFAVGIDDPVLQETLAAATDEGIAGDVVVARNDREADGFWQLRHAIPDAEKPLGAALKHDVAVPVARIADFIAAGERRVAEVAPDAVIFAFGHVGDGNLHYNVLLPGERDTDLARTVTGAVYDLVTDFGGTISAEHGIGVLKRDWLQRIRSADELRLMRTLKKALDPNGILNPGKVLPDPS